LHLIETNEGKWGMLLDLLREIEDQNTKLGSCLERHDTGQALGHHAQIRSLIIEAAVFLLRTERVGSDRPSSAAAEVGGDRVAQATSHHGVRARRVV
jgi:hypothetical protein